MHDLLTIARLDAGVRAPATRSTWPSSSRGVPDAPPREEVECLLEPGVVVIGDRLRLGRLLTNLLDNAERHADSMITISVRRAPGDEYDGSASRTAWRCWR